MSRRLSRSLLRLLLMVLGPLVLAMVVAVVYLGHLGHVSTEDAYVKADMVNITPEVSGRIVDVLVAENEAVAAGQILFRIDDSTYRAGLSRAEAEIEGVRQQIEADRAAYRQKGEELALARADAEYAERELARLTALHRTQALSESALDAAAHQAAVARHRVKALEYERASLLARLSGDENLPAQRHPDYLEAAAGRAVVRQAVARCAVRAPFAGIASRVPDVGQYATSGAPVMSVVADRGLWVEANFKETDLTHVRPGQTATVRVDAYPQRSFVGAVESISQATGAEFSVLPPQNATGNWVKVVQRIPVRVRLEDAVGDAPLRAGMSTHVDIDTRSGGDWQQDRSAVRAAAR